MFAYDYIVVGAGLYGATFSWYAHRCGKKVMVIDKRSHIGGNTYVKEIDGILVHYYGAHIFHTNDKDIWDFVNSFVPFNRYTNSPLAHFKGKLYNLPFNMNTFYQLWQVKTPEEAKAILQEQIDSVNIGEPKNLEEQALKLVGPDIYYKLIKGYTEKQWGRKATELPPFIIKRLPIRFTFDNNYFNDRYQGIPEGGYNVLTEGLLEGVEVRLNTDYFENRLYWEELGEKIVFTGPIDAYFDSKFGPLEYRSLRFEHTTLETDNYQGNAVVNYTEAEIPYTRILEHKLFAFGKQPNTVITHEYPETWMPGKEPYYPINDELNMARLKQYQQLAEQESKVIFGGRLAEYRYYDMHQVIGSALAMCKRIFGEIELKK